MSHKNIRCFFGGVPIDKKIENLLCDILTKLDRIEEYIISTTKKHTEEELEKCYNHIIKNKYLTSDFILNDPILSIKYSDRQQQKRLFTELMKRYDGLKEIFQGWGKRRYIFKKENEEEVLKLIENKKKTSKIQLKHNEYEEIKSLIINLNEDYFSTSKLHDILRLDCGIKDQNKRVRILRDLKQERIIKSNQESTGFYINRMGDK